MNSKNWSDKFVIDSESITQLYKGLAKKNYLKYSNDSTIDVRTGEAYFETDNDNLQDEIDYLVLNYGASNEVDINSNTIAHVSVYDDTTRVIDQEVNIRLFNINSDKLDFATLDWNYIKDNYYLNWFNSLNRVRVVTCELNLSKLDFLSWSETDLIYIEHFKSTFIVLEIGNFIPNRLTKVKLLNYGR